MKRIRRDQRGFALGYAIVLMFIVTLLIAVLLTTALLTSESSAEYRSYLRQKRLLDEFAAAATAYYSSAEHTEDYPLGSEEGQDTEMQSAFRREGLTLEQSSNGNDVRELYVLEGNRIALYLKFEKTEEQSAYTLTAYVYHAGTYPGTAQQPSGEEEA